VAAALHQLAAYLIPTHHSILCDLRAIRNINKEVDQVAGLCDFTHTHTNTHITHTHTFWYAASRLVQTCF
jgi:hypothetical protein